MSWSERYVQNHRRQTDRAIHRACEQLASDSAFLKKFHEMLHCARRRAVRLFEAPICDGRHLGVEALVHLSRFRDVHVRPVMEWAGTASSWRPAVWSLAQHLICNYKVPNFLGSCWYATDVSGDKKRGWYVAHARGASFRSLVSPIVMTRKMEHIFLASQDHLRIEHAIRRAELLALGMPAEFVKAVMVTRLAGDLRGGEFWRTFWLFLISNAGDVDSAQIGPMIDFVHAVRHERRQEGFIEFGPPQPEFSMKGRTAQSMLRLMKEWHKSLGGSGANYSWGRSPFEPWLWEEPARDDSERTRRWQMMELTDSAQLRREGAALHHCVASYGVYCYRGVSSIWSLRYWQGDKVRHVLTVEVDPKRRAVVQARGMANRAASEKSLRMLEDWAARERLRMAV